MCWSPGQRLKRGTNKIERGIKGFSGGVKETVEAFYSIQQQKQHVSEPGAYTNLTCRSL
jgi:hypothetical protein